MKWIRKKERIIIFTLIFFISVSFCYSISSLKLVKKFEIGESRFAGCFDVDSLGNIYLPLDDKIVVYSSEGELIKEIGGEVGGCILVSFDGYVYSAGVSADAVIKKYDMQGNLIKRWGNKVDSRDFVQKMKSGEGLEGYEFFAIGDIQRDCIGNIYVTDVERIVKFNSEGKLLANIRASEIKGDNVKVDCRGEFILLDRWTGKELVILVYDSQWILLDRIEVPREIGSYGIIIPWGVLELDKLGNIYVLVVGDRGSLGKSILILKTRRGEKVFKAYRVMDVKEDYLIVLFKVDDNGRFLYLLDYLRGRSEDRDAHRSLKWFLQIYEIPEK